MTPGLYIDGQRRPKEPERKLDILDGPAIDLRLTPQPLVFEQSDFDEFVAAGGWVKTIPAGLE